MAITAFLSRSPGMLDRGPGGPASLGAFSLYRILSPTATAQSGAWGPPRLGAGLLYRILSTTDWTSSAPSYIIVRPPPSSCGRHKSHSFNLSMVKLIAWYSSTGCTCYLHRCISYFDSLTGVNVLHLYHFYHYLSIYLSFYLYLIFIYIWYCYIASSIPIE